MDFLGRYYTQRVVSNLLIQNLDTQSPKTILDLGIGDASLSIAAFEKWANAKYYATEIERKKAKEISRKLTFVKVHNYDSLNPHLSRKLKIRYGAIDIAICNPPYLKVKTEECYRALFKSIGCEVLMNLKSLTSEIVFLAHNLLLLRKDGELGIIVSDSLITGKEFRIFREVILKQYNVKKIIQLPDKVFNKTEARTHIIILSNSASKLDSVDLFYSDERGVLSQPLVVSQKALIERMDYLFHSAEKIINAAFPKLAQIGATITRGRTTFKELRLSKLSFFHSTHFKSHGTNAIFLKKVGKKHKGYAASKGDILMCRVGKRSVGKTLIIKSGSVIISDCIYRIRVPEPYQKIVFESLNSDLGKKWLAAYSHGVCSQVISKSDLENFPLYSSR